MPSEKIDLRGSYLCGEDLHEGMIFVEIKDLPKAMILRRETPPDGDAYGEDLPKKMVPTQKTYLRRWCPQRRPT